MASMKGFEIGINFIVIIVVAVLILTLGITWIQGVFTSVSDMTTQITARAHENLMEDLRSGDAKMGYTVPNKVKMKRDVSGKFEVGLKNDGQEGRCYSVYPVLVQVDNEVLARYGCSSMQSCTGIRADIMKWFVYYNIIWINGQDVGYTLVDVKPPKNAPVGRYLFQFSADTAPVVTSARACDEYTGDFSDRYVSKQLEITVE